MIGYVFLTIAVLATAGVAYSVAPAGRGVHRLVAPREQLRATISRLEAEAQDRDTKLVGALSEVDGLHDELAATLAGRDNALADLEKAGLRIADLEEQLRDAEQLRASHTALQAQLANAHAIRPLTALTSPAPRGSRVIALHRAPFAAGPAPEPDTPKPPAPACPPAPEAGPNQQGEQPCSKKEAALSATRSSGSSPSPSAPSSPSSRSAASAG